MIGSNKKNRITEEKMIELMMSQLKDIYSNKSSDHYKSRGDITASKSYSKIERLLADLRFIKKYPENEAKNMKRLFNTLHRPIFKKMVSEYLTEPNDRNTIFTCVYTVGYNVLVGELGRIYASTEATEDGIVYRPDKVSKKNNLNSFIASYDESLEEKLDDFVRGMYKKNKPTQEGFSDIVQGVSESIKYMTTIFFKIFGRAKDINPVALISSILTYSYERKVEKFDKAYEMYVATKEAYDEYMKLPESKRIQKIESKYIENIEKYNIKMENLRAEIEHYDQRAKDEMEEAVEEMPDPSTDDSDSEVTIPDDADDSDDGADTSSTDDFGSSDSEFDF